MVWFGNICGLVAVLNKSMRHAVPLAFPLSTLNRPSGILTLLSHTCPGLPGLVASPIPSVKGAGTTKRSNGVPGARRLDGLYANVHSVTLFGFTSNSKVRGRARVPRDMEIFKASNYSTRRPALDPRRSTSEPRIRPSVTRNSIPRTLQVHQSPCEYCRLGLSPTRALKDTNISDV